MSFELGREGLVRFSGKAAKALEAYEWPGNIRELKNVVERAVYRANTSVVSAIIFDPFDNPYNRRSAASLPSAAASGSTAADPAATPTSFKTAVAQFERRLLKKALRDARFNQKKAAARMGLTYNQFRGLYRRHRSHIA
jgi:psp operon transcriptional activator